ncbi:hypothetical protein [Tenacibaculum geojense]|uniref:Lipoprotein n=1 Tax=Tenacibaculum geojense TaxID=915352 RepID=A0ABW3JUL8_9FLAO
MKKNILLLCFFVCTSLVLHAQETTLEKVGKETCEYFTKNSKELSKLSPDEKTAKLGLQMLFLYNKYEKELNAEGIQVDFGDERSAEKLGEKIGMEMAKYCPNVLITLFGDMADEEEDVEFMIEGTIKSIEVDELSTLVVKDSQGKTQKFVWLDNFEGSDDLIEKYNKVKGTEVQVYYKNLEVFSPKLKEYIVRKKISKLVITD